MNAACDVCGRSTRRTLCIRCRAAAIIPGLAVIDGGGEGGDAGDTVWIDRYRPPVPETRR